MQSEPIPNSLGIDPTLVCAQCKFADLLQGPGTLVLPPAPLPSLSHRGGVGGGVVPLNPQLRRRRERPDLNLSHFPLPNAALQMQTQVTIQRYHAVDPAVRERGERSGRQCKFADLLQGPGKLALPPAPLPSLSHRGGVGSGVVPLNPQLRRRREQPDLNLSHFPSHSVWSIRTGLQGQVSRFPENLRAC